MALLFVDGFDHSGTNATIHGTKYGSTAGPTIVSSPVRTGTGALSLTSAVVASVTTKTLTTSGAAIIGFALRVTSNSMDSGLDFIRLREGGTTHVSLRFNGSNRIIVTRGGTTLATGTTQLLANSWYYIELKTTIHDSTGAYELHIDGVSEVSASGVDTRNGGSGTWDNVFLLWQSGLTTVFFDDLYICDGSGSANTDFLGVSKVETILPQTDAVSAGSHADFTPSTGTDHGALVDENPPNTSDYNTGTTAGHLDTYQFPSLSLTGTIHGLQTNLYVAKTDAGARTVARVVRMDGVDYTGTTVSPGTTFGYFSEVLQRHPDTSAVLTSTDVNAMQAGMTVVS